MNISLTPTMDEYVKERVASGNYSNADEVMHEALRLLREKELKAQQLSDAFDKGYEAYKEGRYVEYEPDLVRKIADKVASKYKNK